MSSVKISELPAADAVTGSEVFPVVQSGTTKKVPVSGLVIGQGQVAELTTALSGKANASQVAELTTALSGKANASHTHSASDITTGIIAMEVSDGASEKISDMPVADGMTNAALIPIIMDGVNKSITRDGMLQAAPSERLLLRANSIAVGIAADGRLVMVRGNTQKGFIVDAAANIILSDLPSSDPHVLGGLYHTAGVVMVSAG